MSKAVTKSVLPLSNAVIVLKTCLTTNDSESEGQQILKCQDRRRVNKNSFVEFRKGLLIVCLPTDPNPPNTFVSGRPGAICTLIIPKALQVPEG